METQRMALWQVRLLWLGMITSPIFYCIIALIIAMQQGVSPLEWSGFQKQAPPVPGSILLPVAAFLGLVVPLLLRMLLLRSAGVGADAFAVEPEDEEEVLGRMMGRQILLMGLADVLPTLAMIYVLLWGMMPVLWVVVGEYVVTMAFCFPRLPAGLAEDGR
jgi:hypothetical protein